MLDVHAQYCRVRQLPSEPLALVQELAPGTIRTEHLLSELLAYLRLVVVRNVRLLLQFALSMRECTLQ